VSLENPEGEAKYFAMYTGVVVKRNDPLKLGRVKFRIPGLIEEESAWAWPFGCPGGGGGKKRIGIKFVPRLDAEVVVLFHLGDIDHPYYAPGNWGLPDDENGEEINEAPGGGREPPTGADELDAEGEVIDADDAPNVDVIETESFLIAFDERGQDGKGSLVFRHKKTGDGFEYDGAENVCTMRGTMACRIVSQSVINIEAPQVTINGRQVLSSDNPI